MAFAWRTLFAERSVSKLAGLLGSLGDAQGAAAQVVASAGIGPSQVRVLGPQDAAPERRDAFDRALEPEGRRIFGTLLRTHVAGALAGALLGGVLYALLYGSAQPMVVSSPWLALIAVLGFATTFGLLAAGLVALRPDHTVLMNRLRDELRGNRWAVVVHPVNAQQFERARQLLRASGAQVLSTL